MQRHAELREELHRTCLRKRAQDVAHKPRGPAPEVPLGDDAVGDITSRTAADEDLGADATRPVEADDATRW